MNEPYEHEVYFFGACAKCKHKDLPGDEEPCNECLENSTNFETHKPVKFEPVKERNNGNNNGK